MSTNPNTFPLQYMFGPVNRVEIPLALVVEIPNVHRFIFVLRTRQRDTPSLRVELGMQLCTALRPLWQVRFPHDKGDDNLVEYVATLMERAWKEKDMRLSWDEQGRSSLYGRNFGCVGHAGNFFVLLDGV